MAETGRKKKVAADAAKAAAGPSRKYSAPALEKGIDVLELMARQNGPMTLSQISTALDRSVSELFRMVLALEYKGFIETAPSGEGYVLTNRLFALGMAQAPTKTLLEAALPVMRRLAKSTVQSCHLAVPSDDQIVVVARIESPGDLGFSVRIGYRRPIIDATSGVVLFAFLPDEMRQDWLEHLSEGVSKKRIDTFLERAKEVRAKGYARAKSDFVQGVVDISAPIRGAYRVVGALTVPFVQRLPPPRTIDETLAEVRAASAEISADLHADD
jgi:DNA-binding IclR family transcriptional regulator